MPEAPRSSPFEGTERLIIDGTNLLYHLGTGSGDAAPASAIVGRIRGAVPITITIDLVFDGVGHGVYGRLAQKMAVRYSGRRPADDVILDLASEFTMQHGGPVAADRVLVVTNDRGLRDHLAAKGARTAPLQWLVSRLDIPAPARGGGGGTRRTGIGTGRPPAGARAGGGTGAGRGVKDVDAADEKRAWKPGRGATAKSGTPHKVARHKRHPRTGA